MSTNPYSVLVLRRLAYAKTLLRLVPMDDGQGLVSAALCEGALLHLHGAYLAFLREVGASYQLCHLDMIGSAQELVEALRRDGKSSGEAAELDDLEADPHSWTAGLLDLVRQRDGWHSPSPSSVSSSQESLIQVKSVEDGAASLHRDTLAALVTAFAELVDRQRETMVEY